MAFSVRPLVSVIIPTYGRANHIKRAIDSVLNQSYDPIEIIVVDDNSTGSAHRSETQKVLNEYKNLQSVTVVQREVNGGGAAARNTGIGIASGELITFLDDDDFYRSSKIDSQVQHMLANNLEVSLCDMEIMESGHYVEDILCYAKGVTLGEFILGGVAYTPMIMCTGALLRGVGGFHLTPRFQDHVLMIKLLEKNPRIAILREKLFVHNRHDGERITSGPSFPMGHRIRISFEKRHLSVLSPYDRKRIQLRHSLVLSRIERLERGTLAGLLHIGNSLQYIVGVKDLVAVMKTAARLFIRPDTHF